MDIAAYISELLEHQDKLIVPGLGTFYRSRLEGYYNKEQQQFYPPSLQLQFNAELQEDDGKLVEAMTADHQMATATAKYHIEKYAAGIIQLASTDTVAIGDLGTFTMRRRQLVFMPKKLNNNNELFYGLAPVTLRRNRMQLSGTPKPVMHMPVTEKPSAFTAALLRGEPMPGKSLNSVNEPVPQQMDEDGKKPARISTWILVVALMILISGIALICAYKYNPALFDRFRGQNELPPITTKEKKRARDISDSIQHSIDAQKNIGVNTAVDSNSKSKILAPEAARDTFAIVIGKFKELSGALKEFDRYKYAYAGQISLGIHTSSTDTENPYRLTAITYTTSIDSAKKHLDPLKRLLGLPTLFIETFPYKKQQ